MLAERGVLALPFAWNGWTGIDLLGPEDVVLGPDAATLPAGVTACGAEAVEACRIVSGIPAMGTELTGKTIAAEAGLVERTVSFTKGCYTGQELVARHRCAGRTWPGASSAWWRAGAARGRQPLARGMTLHGGEAPAGDGAAEDKVVGTITSAAWSAELGAWVALGYLQRSVEAPGPSVCARATASAAREPARASPAARRPTRPRATRLRRTAAPVPAEEHPAAGRHRRHLARLGAVVALAYALGAAGTTAFTRPADILTAIPILVAGGPRRHALAPAARPPAGSAPTRPSLPRLGGPRSPPSWLWELAEYAARGSRADHPTLSSMLDAVDRFYRASRPCFSSSGCTSAPRFCARDWASAGAARAGAEASRRVAVSAARTPCGPSWASPPSACGRGPIPGSTLARPGVVLERLATGPFLRVAPGPVLDVGGLAPLRPLTGHAERAAPGRSASAQHRNCNRTSPHLRQRRRNLLHGERQRRQARGEPGRRGAAGPRPWREVGWIFRDGRLHRHRAPGRRSSPPGSGGLMVRVIHLADDGSEMAAIEFDDFTIEVIYSGLAERLHERRGGADAARTPAARFL